MVIAELGLLRAEYLYYIQEDFFCSGTSWSVHFDGYVIYLSVVLVAKVDKKGLTGT